MSKGPGVRPDAKFAALLKSIEVDREFRKRLISNPRAVLKEQGIEISKGKVKIKIVENTPETIYLVLPRVIKAKDYKKITDKINIEAAKLSSLRAGLAISLSLGQDDWDPTMNKANTSFADDEFSGVDGNDRTILGDDTDPSMNPKNKKNDFFGY
jgi:hypothetical protein